MATLRQALKTLLSGDVTLTALATGGVHDAETVGKDGMNREVLAVSGQVAIRPGVYINWTTEGMMVRHIEAVEAFVEVYFYQSTGYVTVETMRRRVYTLLHQKRVTVSTDYVYAFIWAGDVLNQFDESVGGSMERSRYQIHYIRR